MCITHVVQMVKNLSDNAGHPGSVPRLGRPSGEANGHPLPGESHGQRSLTDYSPKVCKELDMTEQLTLFVFAGSVLKQVA